MMKMMMNLFQSFFLEVIPSYNPRMRLFVFILCWAWFSLPLQAGEASPASPPVAPAAPTVEQVIQNFNQENPGIRIDAKNQWLEFDAKVAMREGDMLEDLVCLPMTREHESILVSPALPSRIHLGLLLLGLEPGAPRSVRWGGANGDEPQVIPASGAKVSLFMVYKQTVDGQEKTLEVPANQWLKDANTGKASVGDLWIFTGSRMGKTVDGAPFYSADGEGNTISIVHFGDETLAPHTLKTKEKASEGEDLVCNTAVIPVVGTPVIVRVKPVKKAVAKK